MLKFIGNVAFAGVVSAIATVSVAAEDRFGPYLYLEGTVGADIGSPMGKGYVSYNMPWISVGRGHLRNITGNFGPHRHWLRCPKR